MRILLIHQIFVSPNEAGGTRHFELALRCVEAGHRFTIVASDLSYLTGKRIRAEKGLVTEELLGGIRILRAYTYPALHRSFVWRVLSFISFMVTSVIAGLKAGKVDLVLGTSPPIFQAISAWLVAVIRRKPFVLEVRDLWPEFAIDMGVLRNRILISLSRWLERFLYAAADHIVVNSPAYRDYLLRKGIRRGRISFISNGVDARSFEGAQGGSRFRERCGLDGKFTVTYAGAIGLANDLPTLLRAAARLREHTGIHFVLVGDGKERRNLEKMAREMGLENVTFTGPCAKKDMPEVLAASDACVAILQDIPMFRTTYPNKVFDYMAARKPTILVIDGVIREVIEKSGGGLFVRPGDDAALADAVLTLERDRDKVWEIGKAAREYVVRYFDRDEQAKEFIRQLRKVMEGGITA